MMTKRELKKIFKQNNIELIFKNEREWGRQETGENSIGIYRKIVHLDEALTALDEALKDNFPRVFIFIEEGISKATKEKYTKLIKGKKWTKSDINGFLKLLNGAKFHRRNELKRKEIFELLQLFLDENKEWALTKEQSDLGINWLYEACFKVNGEPRKSKLADNFRDREKTIIKKFSKFKLVGIHEESNSWNSFFYPIYRTYSKDGKYFDYTPIHWGTPIIHD